MMKFGPREIALFALVLLIPVLSYLMVFRPQNSAIDDAKKEIEVKREVLAKLREETSRNADLERANAEAAARIKTLEDRLPSSKGVDRIVRQVSILAVEAGLAPPTLKSQKPLEAGQYREQPLSLNTNGSFVGFSTFLEKLERLPRITRISDMTIEQSNDENTEIEVGFTLSIYFQDDEGGES